MIHVVVTCTSRKGLKPRWEFLARNLRGGGVDRRCETWTRLLDLAAPGTLAAEDLYQGSLWQASRRLVTLGARTTLWVCSAGYGLIRPTSMLHAYGATFSFGEEDSVCSSVDEAAAWWNGLGRWAGPETGQPRTIEELVRAKPTDSYVLVLSEPYLRAVTKDVRSAAVALSNSDRLVVVCAGARGHHGLGEFLLPADARWQTKFGGPRHVLNAKIAEWLLSTVGSGPLSRTALADAALEVANTLESLPVWNRMPLTDEDVRAFIRGALAADGKATKSRLLRRLRDSGRACEQGRFGGLFEEARCDGEPKTRRAIRPAKLK